MRNILPYACTSVPYDTTTASYHEQPQIDHAPRYAASCISYTHHAKTPGPSQLGCLLSHSAGV